MGEPEVWPPGPADQLARRLVRDALGAGARVAEVVTLQATPLSLVLRLSLPAGPPLVLKLAASDAPGLDLGRTAAAMGLAAAVGVPVPAVLAVVGRDRADGVQHLLQEQAGGRPWREVRPSLGSAAVEAVHAQVAEVLAALATVRPAGFGELDQAGRVQPVPLLAALRRRVALRTARPVARRLAEQLLTEHSDRLGSGPPVLTHDDLHHGNLLVDPSTARLVAVLDWDKAWVGPAVADLARVAFWDDMTGPAFWAARRGLPEEDDDVRRLHQLLWCLEHAFPTDRHRADTERLLRSFGLDLPADLG